MNCVNDKLFIITGVPKLLGTCTVKDPRIYHDNCTILICLCKNTRFTFFEEGSVLTTIGEAVSELRISTSLHAM